MSFAKESPMSRSLLRLIAAMAALLTLAGCGWRQQPVEDIPRSFEIRAVSLTAAEGVSPTILRNTRVQLTRAVRDTVRPQPLPRAVLQIHIAEIRYGHAYDGFTALAGVNVVMADVDTGFVILNRDFVIQAFAFNERALTNATVEAIVSRIRVEYGLRQPELREPRAADPRISTRMTTDEPLLAKHEPVEPVQVTPHNTARHIGTDADPILNSKTKVDVDKTPEKAVVLPGNKVKAGDAAPAENALESGANAKVTIRPKAAEAAPADAEPCVETMDSKC